MLLCLASLSLSLTRGPNQLLGNDVYLRGSTTGCLEIAKHEQADLRIDVYC